MTPYVFLCFQIGSLTQADLNSQGGDSVVVVLCHLLDDPDSEIRYWGLFTILYFLPTVITAVFHSVEIECRSLALPSENACARKAASVIASTCSGSRSSKLPFLPHRSKLENVAVFFVFVPLVHSKSELVENFQL